MPDRTKPTRRQADEMLEEVVEAARVTRDGVTMLLSIFDIDIADPVRARAAAINANKDMRFLRSLHLNTSDSIRHARNLSIAGVLTAIGVLLSRIISKH